MKGFMRSGLALSAVAAALVLTSASYAAEQAAPANLRHSYIPNSVSPAAVKIYRGLLARASAARPKPPKGIKPGSDAYFHWQWQQVEKFLLPLSDAALKKSGDTVTYGKMGGVPVINVFPKNYKNDGTVLIYAHGGGWILGSARSSFTDTAPVAAATGKHVISVDYTDAPKGKFQFVTDQIVHVYKAVLAQGIPASHIGMWGGSAGGNIIAGATLKIRNEGLPMPAALYLMCPVADLTNTGDTRVTLAHADPIINPTQLIAVVQKTYVDPADVKNPYASPVYGNFSKGYPPTLIQGGTREVLLSDYVRLYHAIKRGGNVAELDIYEGMVHGFPTLFVDAPEGKAALAEQVKWWKKYLPGSR